MVVVACELRLFDTEEEDEETIGAVTEDGVVRRENDAIDPDVTSLRRRSATSSQTATAALENASDDEMPRAEAHSLAARTAPSGELS
jgi:hypothetical protein